MHVCVCIHMCWCMHVRTLCIHEYISNPRAFNLLVCHLYPSATPRITEIICSLFHSHHTISLTDFQLEFTIWAAINRSMLLSSWIVILRWRWQCFAFEFPKHNYICSWKLHACCCCHYTTTIDVTTAATSVVIIIVLLLLLILYSDAFFFLETNNC